MGIADQPLPPGLILRPRNRRVTCVKRPSDFAPANLSSRPEGIAAPVASGRRLPLCHVSRSLCLTSRRNFSISNVQRPPILAAPGISPRAARSCTVRTGEPRIAAAFSIETRSTPGAGGRTCALAAATPWATHEWRKRQQLAGDLARGLLEEVVAKPAPVLVAAFAGPAKIGPGGREDRSWYRAMVGLDHVRALQWRCADLCPGPLFESGGPGRSSILSQAFPPVN